MLTEKKIDIFRDNLLDPRAISQLKKIVSATNAAIVLSSSWRWDRTAKNEARRQLREHGLDFIDITPCRYDIPFSKDAEIAVWLEEHPEVQKYIIIDDAELQQNTFQVKTDFSCGLTREKAEEAINMLQGE